MCAVVETIWQAEIYPGNRNHLLIILLTMVMLQPTLELVDCRLACRKCHENDETKDMLEVYCAMCEECKLRRREKLATRTPTILEVKTPAVSPLSWEQMSAVANSQRWNKKSAFRSMDDNFDYAEPAPNMVIPPGCPTPPPCSDSEEDYPVKLKLPPPTPAPAPPCPAIQTCRKKKRVTVAYQPCFPCFPMCPCPPVTTTTEREYLKVYVGVPKNLLRM